MDGDGDIVPDSAAAVGVTEELSTQVNDDNDQELTTSTAAVVATSPNNANISLLDITSGENERGIPFAKFIDDVGSFASSFTPHVSAELLIGAFTELFSKFKSFETSLTRKGMFIQQTTKLIMCHLTKI